MRTIIAGSRGANISYERFCELMAEVPWEITTVLSGTARGIDRIGERWAAERDIPIERHPAEWDKYGKSAGYRRNAEMVKVADALVAFWDGKSPGTENTIAMADRKGMRTKLWMI